MLRTHESVEGFRACAGSFLAAHEAHNNLVYGILAGIEDGRFADAGLWTLDDPSGVRAAAVCTPPHNLVLAMSSPEAAGVLADALGEGGERFQGVLAERGAAAAFAKRWSRSTGVVARPFMNQRIYALRSVAPMPQTLGRPRPATPADVPMLAAWLEAFQDEAHPDEVQPREDLVQRAERFVSGDPRAMLLWEHAGRAVSMAGSSGPTPNGIRIGPVYTPPEHRARGFASACVAELSRRRLAQGYRFCFLFTDLANPTSNAIYRRIGYEPVCDVDVVRFHA